MKVYISVDIEGITNVTHWDETELHHDAHEAAARQMTAETLAACRGAIAAGATEIYIKDAHDSARNILAEEMPEEAILIRGWTNAPESMMVGMDETFDAAVFIGYHSGAYYGGNPLSHTMNTRNNYMKINGMPIAEFHLNAWVAASLGVPVVFVSGDQELCGLAKELVPDIETVGVKSGIGNATFNMSASKACRLIEEGVKAGLEKVDSCRIKEPETYEVEISFKENVQAYRASFYPGVDQVDTKTVRYTASSAHEMMTTRMFIL